MLHVDKCFLSVYWEGQMVFLLQSVNMAKYIVYFSNVKSTFYFQNKLLLVTTYYHFYILLDLLLLIFCWGFPCLKGNVYWILTLYPKTVLKISTLLWGTGMQRQNDTSLILSLFSNLHRGVLCFGRNQVHLTLWSLFSSWSPLFTSQNLGHGGGS